MEAISGSAENNGIGYREITGAGILDGHFQAQVTNQTATSVTIDWKLVPESDVYKIEKFHKQHGWERVAWVSESPATVENLEDNFTYRLRIIALKYCDDEQKYEELKTSPDIMATTLSDLPSTLGLFRAIKKGQQFLVKQTLRRRPSLIEYPGPNGYLPLANAITFGEMSIIDVLLTAGASVHIGNPRNARTPLHLAFYYGRLPVARMLLNKRANLEATDFYGMTACHFAIDANQCDILKFGLECGANIEASDACGWTLLLRAVVMGCEVGILKLLIMHGANTKAVDTFGQTCVDLARLYGNEIASQYFSRSAKVQEAMQELKIGIEKQKYKGKHSGLVLRNRFTYPTL